MITLPDQEQAVAPVPEFGKYEEEAIVSLALDMPEFFYTISHFVTPDMFARVETKYVMAWILNLLEKHKVVPTRGLLRDQVVRQLTVDDPFEEILRIVDRPSNPREVPMVRNCLKEWAEYKAYGLLYSEESILAYQKRDLDHLKTILEQASRINDSTIRGLWLFDDLESLLDPEQSVRYPTGFTRLDLALRGGVLVGETLLWLGATGTGKSIWLANNSVNSVLTGLDTLHVSFEMSARDTALRCLGAMTEVGLQHLHEHKDFVRSRCAGVYATHQAKLAIYEMAPDEHSVDQLYGLLSMLKRNHGFAPKILVIDYLELMLSRNKYANRDDYRRQKHVATEVCGLAKSEQVVIYSATQTNRGGAGSATHKGEDDAVNDLNKMAESFGKGMPVGYVVSLNQTKAEYQSDPPQIRMFIAKNRYGEKLTTITCHVNYHNMKAREMML